MKGFPEYVKRKNHPREHVETAPSNIFLSVVTAIVFRFGSFSDQNNNNGFISDTSPN